MTPTSADATTSPMSWLEQRILSVTMNGLRLTLTVYFLTFGLFGYGSELQWSDPLSFSTALAGLLLGCSFLFVKEDGWLAWQFKVRLKLKHVLFFLTVFFALSGLSWNVAEGELVGDELAYAGLATAHSSQVLGNLPFDFSDLRAASVIQVGLVLTLFVSVVAIVLIFKVKIKMAIAGTVLFTLVAQIGFATLGGWGWGYADVSWYPYLVTTTLFGVSPLSFSLTSIAIVSAGLSVLFFGLQRNGLTMPNRFAITAATMTLPVPFLYFSALDHVVYFFAFSVAIAPFLISRITESEFGLAFLVTGVGVMFRLTLVLVLSALVISALTSGLGRSKRDITQLLLNPVHLLLVPYGIGIVTNPPVFSGRSGTAKSLQGVSLEQIYDQVLNLSGVGPLVFLAIAVAMTFAGKRFRLQILWIFGICSFSYFVALRGADLAGEPKYSLEWLPLAVVVSGIAGFAAASTLKSTKIGLALKRLLVLTLVMLSGTNLLQIALGSPPFGSAGRSLDALDSYREVGYSAAMRFIREQDQACTPVGVVYGNMNEVLGGLSWQHAVNARNSFSQVQIAQASRQGSSWTQVLAEDLLRANVTCAYGQRSAFSDLGSKAWAGWDVAFQAGSDSDQVVVLNRPEESDLK